MLFERLRRRLVAGCPIVYKGEKLFHSGNTSVAIPLFRDNKCMELVLFNALPPEFSNVDVKNVAARINLPERTARRYVAKFLTEYRTIERIKYGHYNKVVQNNASGDPKNNAFSNPKQRV